MQVARKNQALNEAIEILDQHLARYGGDKRVASMHLHKEDEEFIDGELLHCMQDARYYMENYHVVNTENEGLKTLYPFWDSQEMIHAKVMYLKREFGFVKLCILKARQLGSSTYAQGISFHRTIFTETTNTLIVAQDPGQADYLFGMSRLAFDSLPWWMRPEQRYQAKGRYLVLDKENDLERQVNPGLKSNIFVEAANKMTGVARGKTLHAAHMSELASWNDGGMLSQSIMPTMNAQDGIYIMESTAEGRTGFWYTFWRDTVERKTEWEPLFIEYFRVKKYSRPIKDKAAFSLTDEELALRDKVMRRSKFVISDETFNWVRIKKQEFRAIEGDEWKFYQEYPVGWVEAFQGSGQCAFPKKLLQKILESQCVDPKWTGEIYFDPNKPVRDRIKLVMNPLKPGDNVPNADFEGDRLRVWEQPEDGCTYYVGVDVAHGIDGGDYSVCQVIRIGQGQEPDTQVAEWHGWINPTPFAYVAAGLGYWYNEAQIAIECNDVGMTTNNELFRIIEYENIYRWKHIDKVKNFITDLFGWWTNSKTRDLIIAKGRESIVDRTMVMRSEALVDEAMDFSSEDGGRFEGQDTHDDRVMAWLIARYCAHESDYGREAAARPSLHPPSNVTHYVFDGLQRLRWQGVDKERGEDLVKNNLGWSMRSMPQRRDFANTDFSPVHDRPGLRQRMHYTHGVPAEMIHGEMLMHFQMAQGPTQDDDADAEMWKRL